MLLVQQSSSALQSSSRCIAAQYDFSMAQVMHWSSQDPVTVQARGARDSHLLPGSLSSAGRKGGWSRWLASSERVCMALKFPPQPMCSRLVPGLSSV